MTTILILSAVIDAAFLVVGALIFARRLLMHRAMDRRVVALNLTNDPDRT